ncbi:MAG: GntR family transcriptional regulator [Myxococcales bacterium]|nr:GntR family transcriptional regulator [Myxococcales bacterium]MCB9647899.1 GntR family transcriptional regulator [Deltaproteobacteria bacterium]
MTPEHIATLLKQDILSGALPPGAELSQPALAGRFGVSRIPVRDALRDLAGQGLVEVIPNRGAYVISLSADEVREIYDLRILLECDCLARAAEKIQPKDFTEIERVRRKSDLDAATPLWAQGEWEFHRTLYAFAGRPRQITMIERLRQTCQIHISAYASLPAKKKRWLADHARMVELLRKGGTYEAVAVLEDHLRKSAEHLLARMG